VTEGADAAIGMILRIERPVEGVAVGGATPVEETNVNIH
jgi:hypothetical protein